MRTMASYGQRLKHERERRGLSRFQVAEATSIYIHDLAALEFERLEALPGGDEVVRLLRRYAEFLELEPDTIVDEFRRESSEPVDRGNDPASEEPARPEPEEPAVAPAASESTTTSTPALGSSSRRPFVRPGISARLRVLVVAAAAIVVAVSGWWALRDTKDGVAPARQASPPVVRPSESPRVVPGATTTPDVTSAPVETEHEATVEPAPSTAPPVVTDSSIRVNDFGVGTDVVDHMLVGENDRFDAGSRVWFWTRVEGAAPGSVIEHVWLHEGRAEARITLEIGSRDWRTQSSKRVGARGRWAVEARTEDGAVVARVEFECR